MKLRNLLLGAAAAAGTLITLALPASAYVACNREGDCWHTESRYSQPGVSFDYHPDDWYFHRHWEGDARTAITIAPTAMMWPKATGATASGSLSNVF